MRHFTKKNALQEIKELRNLMNLYGSMSEIELKKEYDELPIARSEFAQSNDKAAMILQLLMRRTFYITNVLNLE